MVTSKQLNALHSMLEAFVHGEDRSMKSAGHIEVLLEDMFPGDDQLQEYVTFFASYRPGGGDYLYDETQMAAKCEELLAILSERVQSEQSDAPNKGVV